MHIVTQRIGPVSLPEQFHSALGAVMRQNARTTKLHEPFVRVTIQQCFDLEFGRGVEAAIGHRHVLAQEPVGADDLVFRITVYGGVHYQKMVADLIEAVDITLAPHGIRWQLGVHFVHENAIA